jgi:hypothetical protein
MIKPSSFGFNRGHLIGFSLAFFMWVVFCLIQAQMNSLVKDSCPEKTHRLETLKGTVPNQYICVRKPINPKHTLNIMRKNSTEV